MGILWLRWAQQKPRLPYSVLRGQPGFTQLDVQGRWLPGEWGGDGPRDGFANPMAVRLDAPGFELRPVRVGPIALQKGCGRGHGEANKRGG